MMTQRNIGKIYISGDLLGSNPDEVATILSEISFVPVRVEHLWSGRRFECEGLSPMFRELSEGECTPLYELIIVSNKDGAIEVTVLES